MNNRTILIDDNVRLIRLGITLIESLDNELYGKREAAVSSSGIGAHMRHCLDHYESFLRGLPAGRIDYDQRERDERLETQRDHALVKLRALELRLKEAEATWDETPLQVKMDACAERPQQVYWTSASFERELQFLLSHTVHHYALIAVILRLNHLEPPEGLGVAPSTLRFWEESRACAP